MNERIDNKYLTASHRPGEVILAEDMNELESVVKAGINANYEDIQKIEDGTIMVGNASQLQGATLSTYSDSSLSDDDNKFPSSRQVKRYIDSADSDLKDYTDGEIADLKGYVDDQDADLLSALGASLSLDINESTYVVTVSLKNSVGTVLSTGTIDLPLESVVVNGGYDSETKKIILTLESGSTIEFSVADLVSGLQTEITSNNKLDSDLVDDTSQTNKFITSAELTKLSGIETGAEVNIIESITINGTPVIVTNKDVSFTIPTKVSDLNNDSGFITKSVDDLTNYTDTTTLNTALGGKQETLVSGTNIKTINNYSLLGSGNITIESSGGTADYDQLNNRPQINSVTLTGNKSLSDLGIVIPTVPTNVSAFTNDSGYQTASDVATTLSNEVKWAWYGTSSTSASTQAKVVTCEGFKLETGSVIFVKFDNAQTYNGAPTLNVNGTGAKTVQIKGGTSGIIYMWSPGEIVGFVYDGTYWVAIQKALATKTYYGMTKLSSSATSTSDSLALTPSALTNTMNYIVTGLDIYSSSSTYAIGDRVRYDTKMYECSTAITEAESWTAEHWTELSPLLTQVDEIRTNAEALTLATSGWELNSETDLYEYEVTNVNVTTNHKVDLILDITNQAKFTGSAYTETFAGSYKIYTDELPEEAISCTAYIIKVGV